jgi:hypothetical protein
MVMVRRVVDIQEILGPWFILTGLFLNGGFKTFQHASIELLF